MESFGVGDENLENQKWLDKAQEVFLVLWNLQFRLAIQSEDVAFYDGVKDLSNVASDFEFLQGIFSLST